MSNRVIYIQPVSQKREWDTRNIWGNNSQKNSKIDTRYETTYLKNLENKRPDKYQKKTQIYHI